MESDNRDMSSQTNPKQKLSIDYKVISLLLLAALVATIVLWKPWQSSPSSDDRVITVTGESTVKAEPDEYVFYPSYEFKNKDKTAALAELTKKSEEITAKLKELGVADSKIKSDSSGYNYGWYYSEDTGENNYSLQFTVTVGNKELAQKVQDYLITTSPSGAVSPQANFSDSKRKELEDKARDEATKDARAKADKSANNIGFKVGKVKSVSDGTGFGEIMPMARDMAVSSEGSTGSSKPQLTIQPGENELNYSVTVVYYIR